MRSDTGAQPESSTKRIKRLASLFCTTWIVNVVFPALNFAIALDSRPITANDLVKIRDIGGYPNGAISLSPNGKYVAFQLQTPNPKNRDYDLDWYVVETRQGGKEWNVDDGGEILLNPNKTWLTNGSRQPAKAQWSQDGEWIYYLKKSDSSTQLWRSNRRGGHAEQLTHNAADVLSFQFLSERLISFSVAIPEPETTRLLREEGDVGFLYDERFYPSKQATPFVRTCRVEDESLFLALGRTHIERECVPSVWIHDIYARDERKANSKEVDEFGHRANAHMTDFIGRVKTVASKNNDGRNIWFENDDPGKFRGWRPPLRLYASATGHEFRCGANECQGSSDVMEGAWWRPGRNEIVFQRADGVSNSKTGLYSWNPEKNNLRKILQTEDKLSSCHILEHVAICLREHWTQPNTICAVDLDSGEVKTIYDPNPEFSRFTFSRIEMIVWEDQFGNPTHGHLVYPIKYQEGNRYPLVITTYYSRGFLRGGVGDEYPIHALAANGFLVLSFSNPYTSQRNSTVQTPGRAQWEDLYEQRSALSAQEKIIHILEAQNLIDRSRVAITGLSAGAVQVIFALTQTNKFTTGIGSSAHDWRAAYYSSNEAMREYRRRVFNGAPYEDTEGIFQALSLGLNAEQVNASLLINISDQELRNSVESFARLQDAERAVEMYVFPDEYHIKWQPQHRLAIYRRNIQWLKFWLQGEEVDAPVDPNQYTRWRAMREKQCERLQGDEAPWYCRP